MGKNFRSPDEGSAPIQGAGKRIGIVCAHWNEYITRRLLHGTTTRLIERGVNEADTDIAWVPGAFEVPLAAKVMAGTGRYDAVIGLGCVIRGDTAHFEYVAGPAAEGIQSSQLAMEVPIIFGVLTTENRRQALVRSTVDDDVVGDNKGAEAADTALEMIAVLSEIRKRLTAPTRLASTELLGQPGDRMRRRTAPGCPGARECVR